MVLLAPLAVPTVPGVEVVGDGLTAVLHDGFPGVLLRVIAPGARSAWIVRQDGEAEVPVRSGAPLRLSTGHGHAYDAEATPGATYRYAALVDGVEVGAVVVRLPDFSPWLDSRAWLKSATDPGLSRLVLAGRPEPISTPGATAYSPILGGLSMGRTTGVSARSWRITVIAETEPERAALDRLLASGPLLWQPRPSMESPRISWLGVDGVEWSQIGGHGRWVHVADVAMTEVSRPATTTTDPLRIPGWGWHQSTSGLANYAAYASAYPTTWDQLKAGIAGWTQ